MRGRIWHRFDFVLFGTTILLTLIGLLFINSAASGVEELQSLVSRQMLYAGVGVILIMALAWLDYHDIAHFRWPIYLATVGTMAAVFILGAVSNGVRSWLGPGGSLQPAELAKMLMIIALAYYLGSREGRIGSLRVVLGSLALVVPVAALIIIQPDLGLATVLLALWFGMVWMAGLRWQHLGLFAGLSIPGGLVAWNFALPYMKERIMMFVSPDKADPQTLFNVRQALISIGSGGWFGKGYANGTQSQLHFLRVRHTDFIFSLITEEAGFVGATILLLLFGLLLFRILRAARLAPDAYGRLICYGVAIIIFFEVFVNVGMNLNLLPVTGLTLPFISYGGSSLVTLMMGIGLVESVVMRERKYEF